MESHELKSRAAKGKKIQFADELNRSVTVILVKLAFSMQRLYLDVVASMQPF